MEKRRARFKWQRSHLPSDKRTYNNQTCSLKNSLRKYNAEIYQKYFKFLNISDNSLWKATKSALKQRIKIPSTLSRP